MKTLTVIAVLKAKPGMETALRQQLLALIPTTRQEPGCINYDLHQATDQPGHFLFHENWTSKQHLDDHLARPHLQAFLARVPELVAEPPQITLWEKIG
ncbi:MAG TPA: putative quinol monooxygenase [Verrucomicrobiae bacterium]